MNRSISKYGCVKITTGSHDLARHRGNDRACSLTPFPENYPVFQKETGFFDWFHKNGPAEKSKTLALISNWSQNDDGSISGTVEKSDSFNVGVQITTSPTRSKACDGAIVVTVSGSRYQLGAKKPTSSTAPDLLRTTFDFLDGLQRTRNVALLFDWQANRDGTLTGIVSQKKGFNDGAKITTSPVIDDVIAPGRTVRTRGGSYYRLL